MGQLDEAVSVTLDAAGAGTVYLAPRTVRAEYRVYNVAIDGDSADTAVPEFRLYLGAAVPQQQIAASVSGNADNVAVDITLRGGQRLTGAWTGGTPGAVHTMSVYGSFDRIG